MKSNNLQSTNSVKKSPYNFLSKAKIQTFRKLDRKGSIFNLIKEAKTIKSAIDELDEKRSSLSSNPSREI